MWHVLMADDNNVVILEKRMLPVQFFFRICIVACMITVIMRLNYLSIALYYYACKCCGIILNKIVTHYSQNYAGILASCLIRYLTDTCMEHY